MHWEKSVPMMICGALLVIFLILLVIVPGTVWRIIFVAAALACLSFPMAKLIKAYKLKHRKYHLYIPFEKKQPLLEGTVPENPADTEEQKAEIEETVTGQEPESKETIPSEPEVLATDENQEPDPDKEEPAPPEQTQETAAEPASEAMYIGHAESKKFHIRECKTLPTEKNRVDLATREEAITKGYTPCTYCKP